MASRAPSEQVRQLLRAGAQIVLQSEALWAADLNEARWATAGMEPVAADPVLASAADRATRATVRQWAAANVRDPGAPVVPTMDADTLGIARALVRRGLDASSFDAYRLGHSVAWRLWMKVAFSLTTDRADLAELLDVSAESLAEFVESTTQALGAWMRTEQEELVRSNHPERREVIALLLEGAPVPRERAEARLGYALDRSHVAAVVWSAQPEPDLSRLERTVEDLTRALRARSALIVVPGGASIWVWLPVTTLPDLHRLTRDIDPPRDVLVAIGPVAGGVDGFRRSHLGAVTAQRMVAGLGSDQRVVTFDEVQLVSLVTADRDAASVFVRQTLGPLAHASPDLQETVLTFVRTHGNVSRTAEALFVHRNTVLRRLEKAETLLPHGLRDNPVHVAVALEVQRWFGPQATRRP